MRLSTRVSTVACAGVLASACTDATGISSRSLAPRASLSASVMRAPASYPNSQKYRDTGFQPATGRSGSAAIAVRALLGLSGTTDVEVTTGTFDGGPTTGSLASVQVKGYSPAGALFLTRNHTGLEGGGSASFAYAGLARGTPLQVQAVVRDVGGARSDVVTVTTAVRMRPDLVATRLEGPAEAPIGAAVNFHAFVAERHGEVGARASCVLYVNGAAVDRADGIWVNAGGVVACAMTYRFTEVGTHALEVRVENVRPGDYDDANNRATASVRVVAPTEFTAYSVQAHSIVENSSWRAVGTLTRPDGTVETWDQTYTRQGPSQYASVNGIIPGLLSFPIRLQGEMVTNGTTINTLDRTHATGQWVDWQQGYCATSFAFEGGATTYVCVYTGGHLAGYTHVQYDWWGADVRYHSDSYVTWWDASGELREAWIPADWTQVAPMVTFGPDFHARLSVLGAGDDGPTTAMATVSLGPFRVDYDYTDPSCSAAPASTSCHAEHFHYAGVSGFVAYGSWPPFVP
jgi:hypothetical protein